VPHRALVVGAMPVKAITTRDVRRWAEELAQKTTIDRRARRKLSPTLRKHCLNLVRACLEQAIQDGLIENNPAVGIKVRQEGDTGEKWDYLREPMCPEWGVTYVSGRTLGIRGNYFGTLARSPLFT